MAKVPEVRVTACNDEPVRRDGELVVYWMTAQRRLRSNFALEHAIWWANDLERPLLVFEPLRCGYQWASERIHRFILDGMRDHARQLESTKTTYYPYVEDEDGAGQGLLEALAERACVIVADDYPCFFLPRMVAAAAEKVGVCMEKVDSNGLLPLRVPERTYTTAYSFRRGLHKMLPEHLDAFPNASPLRGLRAPELAEGRALRDPVALARRPAEWLEPGGDLSALPIDHQVAPVEYRWRPRGWPGAHGGRSSRSAGRLPRRSQQAGGRRREQLIALPALRTRGAPTRSSRPWPSKRGGAQTIWPRSPPASARGGGG